MTLSRDPAPSLPDPPPDQDAPEPPSLRRLRMLVTTLMVVLILGMVSIVAVLVIRLGGFGGGGVSPAIQPIDATAFEMPLGAEVTALGRGSNMVLVWLRLPDGAEVLHEYDAATGTLRSATPIRRE
ncbi:MAG: DUF6476 family protein [Pseudomonadota bacterium]